MPTERITIVIEERGSRTVKRRLKEVGTSASVSAQGVNLLKTALGGLGLGFIVRELVRVADSYTNLQNRLRLATSGTAELNVVTRELLALSNRTRTSFEGNAELFNRVALSTRELGISQRDVLTFTENLNKAILISGANTQEASTGLIQLSQALSSTRLHGDELRSVMEQLRKVADVLAESMGVTRGELKRLGSEGKISSKILLDAFIDVAQGIKIEEEFKNITKTVSQSFTILKNQTMFYIGELNISLGVTEKLGAAIRFLANDMDLLARVVGPLGLVAALTLAIASLKLFLFLIAANPLGALILAITFTIALLASFSDRIMLSGEGFSTLQDLGVVVFDRILISARIVVNFFRDKFGGIADIAGGVFKDIDFSIAGFVRFGAIALDGFIGIWIGLFEAIKILWSGLGPLLIDLTTQAINGLIGIVEIGIDGIFALFQTLGHVVKNIALAISRSFSALAEAAGAALVGETENAKALAEASVALFESHMGLAFSNLPGRLADNFEQNAETDLIPRIENIAEGAGTRTGQAMLEGLVTGMESSTIFQESVEGLLAEAELIASIRRRKLAEETGVDIDLSKAPGGGGVPAELDPARAIKPIIEGLVKQQELLRLNNKERVIANELLKLKIKLDSDNIKITSEQEQQIEVEIRRIEMLKQITSALDEVRGAEIDLVAVQIELNAQVKAGTITIEQSKVALLDLELEMLKASTTMEAGFKRGFIEIGKTVNDFGAQAEATLVNAFNSAEDALVEFVTTGKISFKSLVTSILADLTRLLARQAIAGLLTSLAGAAIGGAGGGGGAQLRSNVLRIPGRTHGGPVNTGGLFGVNERGGELFVPTGPGNIIPAGKSMEMMAPTVNVSIVNVTDPNEIAEALTTPEGEKAILNVLARNRRAVREIS